jgi:hypothetical protein
MTTITDDNGTVWTWDSKRVFSQEAEQEIAQNGGNTEENGYPAAPLESRSRTLRKPSGVLLVRVGQAPVANPHTRINAPRSRNSPATA